MANWKKVVVSGSSPNFATLQVDNLVSGSVVMGGGSSNLTSRAVNGTGSILATQASVGAQMISASISGSFTGSFFGDGSGLTNLNVNGTRIATGSVSASVDVIGKLFTVESSSIELFTVGNTSASFGVGVTASAGFYGTASWSEKTMLSLSSSYPFNVTGSTIYSNTGEKSGFTFVNGLFIGQNAGVSASSADNATFIGTDAGFKAEFAQYSNFIGNNAGYKAENANDANFIGTNAGYSASSAISANFIGQDAGYNATSANSANFIGRKAGEDAKNATNSNFIGTSAGLTAVNANNSNFLGQQAGELAANANNSNFLGINAGYQATNAAKSNFIGSNAGGFASSASYSTLIGYQAGFNATTDTALGIKTNNIIIGTNVTLENGRQDSINLAGIIFGTGSYFNTGSNPYSGSANGKIGINQPLPEYNFDVSGSGRYTHGLIVSGTLLAPEITGSLHGTASWAQNAINAVSSSYPFYVTGSDNILSHNTKIDPNHPNGSTDNSLFIGSNAGSGSENSSFSNFIGKDAGVSIKNTGRYANYIGTEAGYQANFARYSNFIGWGAGKNTDNAEGSTFIGQNAGASTSASQAIFIGDQVAEEATFAKQSVIIGTGAGTFATKASGSVFLGFSAGGNAESSSYSTFIGYRAGYKHPSQGRLGSNNIVIGTNITLEAGTNDGINIGGIIFGANAYSNPTGLSSIPYSGSANGKIGINQPLPEYNFDVSGSGRYTHGLIVSGTLIAPDITGSLFGTASWAQNAISASYISGSGIVTGSFTGSFYGMFSGSAALQYTASNGLGISTFKYNGSENVKVEVSGAATLSNDTLVMWKTGSGVFANSTISENQEGVLINNSGGVTIEQGGIIVSGSSTFHNNVVFQGNVTVQGTASFQNTTNLEVADQFILLSSGSSTFQDSGIIVNGGSNLSGSAFFLETNSTSDNGRWAVQANLLANATTATPDEYMVSAKLDGTPSGAPSWGGATNGLGNMWIDTGSGDIYIYA